MINPKDIRIGNILNIWTLGRMEVRPVVLYDFYKECEDGDHLSTAEPVILNDDWLINKMSLKKKIVKGHQDGLGEWWCITEGPKVRFIFEPYDKQHPVYLGTGTGGPTIKYVHEAQNYFWALSTLELPIKL